MRKGILLVLAALLLVAQDSRDLRIEPAARLNPLRDPGSRWALVVGISSYKFLPPAIQLHFAHRDAQEFAAFLRSPAGGALPADHIRLLTDDQASLAQIRASLENWLPGSSGPQDIVYVFFAGHGVLDDNDDGYFVAADSDPQNLHATALSFYEVDASLSGKVRSGLTVLIADACHTGRLGWSSYQGGGSGKAADSLARIGQGDRSFLKLLASGPSEASFEDAKWDGGHGVFTHSLLNGLNGEADRDGDRVVRAAEAIEYLSRKVPEQTGSRQHPRVAGTFDARVALASVEGPPPARPMPLDVSGPARTGVYIDNTFRGQIRPAGFLRLDALLPGPHRFSADFPDGSILDGTVLMPESPARVAIVAPSATPLAQLRLRIRAGRVLEPGGAWDYYRSQSFTGAEQVAATAAIGGALEDLGQACVSDYVDSTAMGLKGAMLQRAVDAFDRLKTIRPNDASIEVRGLFCEARLRIAQTRFAEAIPLLEATLKKDARFACAYNALGVALARVNRAKESRQAFETAAKLTPEWGLPPFQIASQLVAAGNPGAAVPYLEKAVAFNPRSITNRWNLAHVARLAGNASKAERAATDLIALDANYPPAYVELGQIYEMEGKADKAAEAYDAYVLLAPNYTDTNAVRSRAASLRGRAATPPPTLRK